MRKNQVHSNQISIFDLLAKIEVKPKPKKLFWYPEKLIAEEMWVETDIKEEIDYYEKKAKDDLNWFKKDGLILYYINLEETNGIQLIMHTSTVNNFKEGSYSFRGFIYKNKFYTFPNSYLSTKEKEKLPIWWKCIYHYNQIHPFSVDKDDLELITSNIKKIFHQETPY